jgi:antibiotic biosynthesis monooxygenase (ABM) superfamily enzyme
MGAVHVAVTRTVLPGLEKQFNAKLLEFVRDSMGEAGVTGVHVLKPPPESGSQEYGILRSFESETAAEMFYASASFAKWARDVEPLVSGEPIRRTLTGLEAFFRSGGDSMPPRWKMAVVTFLGVLPTVMVCSTLLASVLSSVHWLLGAAIMNVAVVVTLTWVVMPFLTKCFDGWLHAKQHKTVMAGMK